jgi:hypothetical protein
MTTYAFHLTLRETEMTVMSEALDLYIKHCREELAKSGREYLRIKMNAAQEVRSCLHSNPEQTSGNNFFESKYYARNDVTPPPYLTANSCCDLGWFYGT